MPPYAKPLWIVCAELRPDLLELLPPWIAVADQTIRSLYLKAHFVFIKIPIR